MAAIGALAVLGLRIGASAQSVAPSGPASLPPIDYADPASWITVPLDAVEPVDVFYVPPTMGRSAPSGPDLTPIDDPKLRAAGPEAAGFTGVNPVVLPGARVINPISWVRDETPAPASDSLGSLLPDASGRIELHPGLADAVLDLDAGVVRVSTLDPARFVSPSGAFPEGVLHSVDIPLFWADLAHNAAVRWVAWSEAH